MFRKKPTIVDGQFGTLRFSGSMWDPGQLRTPAGSVQISIEGSRTAPDDEAMRSAREVMADIAGFVERAVAFIRADAGARDFMAPGGSLEPDGCTFSTSAGTFSINFGLTDWPDAMLDVQFAGNCPFEVRLGD